MQTGTKELQAKLIRPGEWEAHDHWYPKALNSTIHPMINFFLNLETERIISRYCHMHPMVNEQKLRELLSYRPRYFRWAGADLINVTSAAGRRQMVIIENNSCPSGQKSMPLREDHLEQGGYRRMVDTTIIPMLNDKRGMIEGKLAVIYDKNPMEASGYAGALADALDEPVYYVPFYNDDPDPSVRFDDGIMLVRDDEGQWHPIRAAFRYVTQKPWSRIPLHTRTRMLNPIVACLAGGRNKMVASKAYDFFNAEISGYGLKIQTPETIWDVSKAEIPLWVAKLGGQAVIKVPYSNAGQGVFTIINQSELDEFMEMDFEYERFIVQSLIGNYQWSSNTRAGKLYHVGTVPNSKGYTYVADLRMMVNATPDGIRPLCVYARRAAVPLIDKTDDSQNSWAMLGTNLSFKNDDGSWDSDTTRLILMDRRDFNKLGLGLDDLIEAYIQTILSTVAIDQMSQTLYNVKGRFRTKLFKSLNNDPSLLDEILLD